MKGVKNRIVAHLPVVFVFLTLLALFSGCASKEAEEIKIGAIMPLTGDNASYGLALKKGMDLAIDQINAQNGIQGKIVRIIFEDDQANPQLGVNAFTKLVNVDRVPMVLGAMFSAVTLAIAPIAEQREIVLLSPTSSAVEITTAGDYTFRIYPSDSYDGFYLADFAFDELNARNISILNIQVTSVTAITEVFINRFENRGGNITGIQSYSEGEIDFKTQIAKIKQSKPDIIFLPGYLREMAIQLRQIKEFGLSQPILTISTFYDPNIFDLAGNATDNVFFSTPYFNTDSRDTNVVTFVEQFFHLYDHKPNIWSGYGYDVVRIASVALGFGGEDASRIKEELYKITNFPGVTGLTTFDINGDVMKDLRILIAKDGQFIPYKPESNY